MQQKSLNNRYELERKIGEGGMARVYRGRDLRLNRPVAVKVLHSQYADDHSFLSRFQHEAQAAANLSHQNVVDVYDVGQDGDQHYIVMEYIEGRDLKALINREAPLDVARAVSIAEGVALGLAAAHRVGLVHRDVKPQNIMVGEDGQVQITDFGIAKSHLSTARTETGVTFGTADYIAPEQAQGLIATPQSDIYSLGVVLYEMLTGRLPFTGENAVAVALQHVSTPPPPPRRYNPTLPPQLESLVLQALAKKPAERPQSAQEFARLLSSYRNVAGQATMVGNLPAAAPALPPRSPVSTRPSSSVTGPRASIPPPRSAAKAPSQQGIGCGGFVLGFLIVGSVLGMVLLYGMGAFDNLLAAGNTTPQPPSAVVVVPTVTATVTATPGPTPTASPTPLPTVVVPDLVGRSGQDAQDALFSLGLLPAQTEPRSDDLVPEGNVISQTIQAGSVITQGQSVTYTLSLGPELIAVGNYLQTRADRARQLLEGAGLRVEIIEQGDPSVSAGFVINQAPAAPARLERGDTVQLIVSLGDKILIPDLIGLNEQQAIARINQTTGLFYSYSDQQGPDKLGDLYYQVAPGTVVSCTPGEGQWVDRNTGVTLGVRGP